MSKDIQRPTKNTEKANYDCTEFIKLKYTHNSFQTISYNQFAITRHNSTECKSFLNDKEMDANPGCTCVLFGNKAAYQTE